MGDPEKGTERLKAENGANGANDAINAQEPTDVTVAPDLFFSKVPEAGAMATGTFGDAQPPGCQGEAGSMPAPGAEINGENSGSALSQENQSGEKAKDNVIAAPELSAQLKSVLRNYLDTAKKLLFSPLTFFTQMERAGGLAEPAIFLSVSALANGIISALLGGFNLGLIPRNSFFVLLSCGVMSGLAYMMAKSMGSKCTFEMTFRVFAFCSCLSVLGAIPGLNLLVPVACLTLYFLGLRAILSVSLYQTVTIMFLLAFMQVLLNLGQMFTH